MDDKEQVFEIASFAPGGVSFGSGLLGATGFTPEQAQAARLEEIERRILEIEARLKEMAA